MKEVKRCNWCNINNQKYINYHDNCWGQLNLDEDNLYKMLLLESFQAGLSWECVLNKYLSFKQAFDNFDVNKIAKYDEQKIQDLLNNQNIIRNKLKITATVSNAKIFINIKKEYGSFKKYLLTFWNGDVIFDYESITSNLSDKISNDLKKRKMKFLGSTIIQSYLQAIGIINAHQPSCFKYKNNL